MNFKHSENDESITNFQNIGYHTTPAMWCLVSDYLNGCQLPNSLNDVIHKLCNGEIKLVENIKDK